MLTEFEEHRRHENIRRGRHVYRVHTSFDLEGLDVGLEASKSTLGRFGEVIAYLPSAEGSAADRIALGILVGSKHGMREIADGIDEAGVIVEALATRERIFSTSSPAASRLRPIRRATAC